NVHLTATFSEAVQSSTINTNTFDVKDTQNKAVAGTVSLSPDGNTATFTPSSNLAASATYTATISTGVKDLAGNAMAANYVWTFTTAAAPDTTPPTVASTTPSPYTTLLPSNVHLTATFSEAVQSSTINTNT